MGWRELCVQTLPAGLRLVNSLIEYVPAEVILCLAAFGALCLLVFIALAIQSSVRTIKKLARRRSTPPPPTPCPPPSCSLPRTDPASSNIELSSAIKPEASPPLLNRPGTNENNPLVGVYTFFKPGPPTPPVASRLRTRRPRERGRETSLPSGVA